MPINYANKFDNKNYKVYAVYCYLGRSNYP